VRQVGELPRLFPLFETALQRKWWHEHKISVNHPKRRDHLGDRDGNIIL